VQKELDQAALTLYSEDVHASQFITAGHPTYVIMILTVALPHSALALRGKKQVSSE